MYCQSGTLSMRTWTRDRLGGKNHLLQSMLGKGANFSMLYSPSPPSYAALFYVVVGYKLFSSQSYLPPSPSPSTTDSRRRRGGGGKRGRGKSAVLIFPGFPGLVSLWLNWRNVFLCEASKWLWSWSITGLFSHLRNTKFYFIKAFDRFD